VRRLLGATDRSPWLTRSDSVAATQMFGRSDLASGMVLRSQEGALPNSGALTFVHRAHCGCPSAQRILPQAFRVPTRGRQAGR